jgi:hypothetical protein
LLDLPQMTLSMVSLEHTSIFVETSVLTVSCTGRAICVTAEGLTDLCDDIGGADGSEVLLEKHNSGAIYSTPSATLSKPDSV